MAANLPNEVNKFCANLAKIRRSLDETRSSFSDISARGNTGAEFSPKDLLKDCEDRLNNELGLSPTIVVLGQTCWAKAFVVNELFSKQVLPTCEHLSDSTSWRMVNFKYGKRQTIGLSLPGSSYELVDNLVAYSQKWETVPMADLELRHDENDPANKSAILDVSLNHPLLSGGASVIMSPCNHQGSAREVFESCTSDVLPVIIYAIGNDQLTQKDQQELADIDNKQPIFFIHVPQMITDAELDLDLTESARHAKTDSLNEKLYSSSSGTLRSLDGPGSIKQIDGAAGHVFQSHGSSLTLFQQLCSLGFLSMLPRSSDLQSDSDEGTFSVESELVEDFQDFPNFLLFMRRVLQCHLVNATTILHGVHDCCLRDFILYAFDMQRDLMITPKRLEFAKEKETELYNTLMDIASKKQVEIKNLIAETFFSIKDELLQKAVNYDFIGAEITESGQAKTARDLKICTGQIQGLMLGRLNAAVGGKLVESVNVLRDSFTGTLSRCLESLEKSEAEHSESGATEALSQILNAAYKVDITVRAGSSFARILLEKMKQVLWPLQLIQAMPWSQPPKIDDEWKKKVATEMLNSLSEAKLSKSICAQFKDRLKHSHDAFNAALKQLEMKHNGRLERTEEQRLKIRKFHAPTVAKLALESISLRDYLLHGMPQMGREIGRGQYGVVYSCDTWAGNSPCAVKTVVPPDEKHWNDLALEFYYTKNVPEHDRVVNLRGSVIDSNYGGGPAVLLIMDRLTRDLYSAIRTGLDWPSRLQVAIDVVEGMRFLHSQGLVHRDIKLKNVLLDKRNRGKITDLGFCKPEAMMSGSIVGTPIHMAPELFSGNYDNSVDVYAFGILFWYVCAGSVKLPYSFEQCASKDQLWSAVKRGVRPEKLVHFDEECWELMQACWQGAPHKRPLLGVVHPQLAGILERFSKNSSHTPMRATKSAALRNLHGVTSDL